MANIIFTNQCNIQCPFCFASENNTNQNSKPEMIFDAFKAWDISTFLGEDKDFRFCGGEPTLNPSIDKVLDILLKSKFSMTFMTNGLWPKKFKDYYKKLSNDNLLNIRFLFNILEPCLYKKNEYELLNNNLNMVLSQNSTLGFTIYKANFEYRYLVELANKYNIKRIRWSVAAPNLSNYSDSNSIEQFYHEIADRLYLFYKECFGENIAVNQDCNYIPPCYFDKNKLLDISLRSKHRIKFSCSGGSPVDIAADGTAWRCYGLYSVLRSNVKNFNNENELNRYFTRRVRLLDNLIPYEECRNCEYWKNGCNGGCYVFRVSRALKQNVNLVLFPIDDDIAIMQCSPYKRADLIIKENGDDYKILYNEKIIVNEDENTIEFLKEIDGKKTINDLIEKWKGNFSSYDNACSTIINKCRELFENDMIKINYDYKIKPENRPYI
jgi:sulfatase maturation enzyme AslB (radical SAM superfamily)